MFTVRRLDRFTVTVFSASYFYSHFFATLAPPSFWVRSPPLFLLSVDWCAKIYSCVFWIPVRRLDRFTVTVHLYFLGSCQQTGQVHSHCLLCTPISSPSLPPFPLSTLEPQLPFTLTYFLSNFGFLTSNLNTNSKSEANLEDLEIDILACHPKLASKMHDRKWFDDDSERWTFGFKTFTKEGKHN